MRISHVANMSFNAIRENKILAKICEFTVLLGLCGCSLFLNNTYTLCPVQFYNISDGKRELVAFL